MSRLLAAIDDGAAAESVLSSARWLAELLGLTLDVVHVVESGDDVLVDTGPDRPRLLHGDPIEQLGREFEDPDVALAVVGARRRSGGRRPAGHVTTSLLVNAGKPLVVVPPDCRLLTRRRTERVLVPLDGTHESSLAVERTVELLAAADMEIIVLHVFDAEHIPRFWDQHHHAGQSWAREFTARFCATPGVDMRLRTGVPGEHVLSVASDEAAGLIAMGWAQDLSAGKAATIREVLSEARVPVLLLPAARADADADAVEGSGTSDPGHPRSDERERR